ncbi:uncharacterized protein LOC143040095 [Oratosquilla oratoria]|uniref:uncharacterized protein LOC143040095 n=1 Tax=Oratosquilla oratoria TaxID=337810 RepID=UPI003F75D8CE
MFRKLVKRKYISEIFCVFQQRHNHYLGSRTSFSKTVQEGKSLDKSHFAFVGKLALMTASFMPFIVNSTHVKCAEPIDEEEISVLDAKIKSLELNEASALTHTTLLKQAGGLTIDSSLRLLNQTVRAILDTSETYRRSLHEAADLLEYCIASVKKAEEHDTLWEMALAARTQMDVYKQQLQDLIMLWTYTKGVLENAVMAVYIVGCEFSASSAQQALLHAQQQVESNAMKNCELEQIYVKLQSDHIRATKKLAEQVEKGDVVDTQNDGSDTSEVQRHVSKEGIHEEEKL